uniref:Uncharacterized protein n=1 Tax=Arundo donax TaxID=35708 RepID=A0A0A9FYG6_ARUDO
MCTTPYCNFYSVCINYLIQLRKTVYISQTSVH